MASPLDELWTNTVTEIAWHRKEKSSKNLLWDNFCYHIFQRDKAFYGGSYFRTPTMNPAEYNLPDILLWTQMDLSNELVRLPPMPDEIRHLLGQQSYRGTYTAPWPQTKASRQGRRVEDKTKWKDTKGKGRGYQPKNAGSPPSEEHAAGGNETLSKEDKNPPTPSPEQNEAGASSKQEGKPQSNNAQENTRPRGMDGHSDVPSPSSRPVKGIRSPVGRASAKIRSQSARPFHRKLVWAEEHDADDSQGWTHAEWAAWTRPQPEEVEVGSSKWRAKQPTEHPSTLPAEEEASQDYQPQPYYPTNFSPYATMWLPGGTDYIQLQESDPTSVIAILPTDHQLALTDIPSLQYRFYQTQEPQAVCIVWKEVLNEKMIVASDFRSYLKFINQQIPIVDAAELETGTNELKEAKRCADLLGGSLLLNSLLEARTTGQQIYSLKVNARRALLQLYEFQLISEEVKEIAGTPTWNHMSNTLADCLVNTRFIDVVRTYLKDHTGNSPALYSSPGQLDLAVELQGKLYHDEYYPNDQIYRLNTQYRILIGREDPLTLEKGMRVDIVFGPEALPPREKSIKLNTTWSVKPKGISSDTQQCDITSECAIFLDQVEALKQYSRLQVVRLAGTTSVFQSYAVNSVVQESTERNSQEHLMKVLPEAPAIEMIEEAQDEPKEEPEAATLKTASEKPTEETPDTDGVEEPKGEEGDRDSGDSEDHNAGSSSTEQ